MYSVGFFCASAAREFDTGVEVDADTFHRKRLSLVSAACPWCGKTHRFLLADARVQSPDRFYAGQEA